MNEAGKQPTTINASLRSMRIVSAALMIGVTLFAIIISFLILQIGPVMDAEGLQYKDIFFYASIGLAAICFVIARSLYEKKKVIVKNAPISLLDKLNQYQAALILYMAPCEGAALFSVVVLFLTGNFLLLIVTGLALAAMFSKFPWPKRVISELSLDWKEEQEITGPNN
jgi:hypothetical protein